MKDHKLRAEDRECHCLYCFMCYLADWDATAWVKAFVGVWRSRNNVLDQVLVNLITIERNYEKKFIRYVCEQTTRSDKPPTDGDLIQRKWIWKRGGVPNGPVIHRAKRRVK